MNKILLNMICICGKKVVEHNMEESKKCQRDIENAL